jgi:hypothetical protein
MNDAADIRSPNSWLRVATPEPGYADCVVADIGRIVRSQAGRALLEQIRDSGRDVLIEKPEQIDPPNAWVKPRDVAAAISGAGSDCSVIYDPRHWPNAAHTGVKSSDMLLYNLLLHALDQLRGQAAARQGAEGGPALLEFANLRDYRS